MGTRANIAVEGRDAGQVDEAEAVLYEGRPALIPSLGTLLAAVLTLGLWLLPRLWVRWAFWYRVTNRRIVVETGVLSKRLEQIDLYRINDYTVERPFAQRVMGTGNLVLRTMDKTAPVLALRNLGTDVVALYERLRLATEADKLRRGARVVDYE